MRGREKICFSLLGNAMTGAEAYKSKTPKWCTAVACALHVVQWASQSVLVKQTACQKNDRPALFDHPHDMSDRNNIEHAPGDAL